MEAKDGKPETIRESKSDAQPARNIEKQRTVPNLEASSSRGCENEQDDEIYYDMSDKEGNLKKGLAIIFNHIQFNHNLLDKRIGTQADVIRLEECFRKLNFNVKCCKNLIYDDIMKVMNTVKNLPTKNINCIVIVVLTHGSIRCLWSYDKLYFKDDLWQCLYGKFPGIPKLFFIQACRGEMVDVGLETTDSLNSSNEKYTIPITADYLQMYSSMEGFKSWREENGSWFIQTLCEVFEKYANKYDLIHMLTIVCRKVAINFETNTTNEKTNKTKAMPQFQSTLTKFLKFEVLP